MAVSAINSASSTITSATATGKTKSSDTKQSNFMTLLVAQLRNQDPLNPATNEDFIAQLAQLESLDESKKISKSLESMVSTQEFSSASTLIGKKVMGTSTTLVGDSVEFNGVVSSVSQIDGNVKMNVTQADGSVLTVSANEISQIMQ